MTKPMRASTANPPMDPPTMAPTGTEVSVGVIIVEVVVVDGDDGDVELPAAAKTGVLVIYCVPRNTLLPQTKPVRVEPDGVDSTVTQKGCSSFVLEK